MAIGPDVMLKIPITDSSKHTIVYGPPGILVFKFELMPMDVNSAGKIAIAEHKVIAIGSIGNVGVVNKLVTKHLNDLINNENK